MARHILYVIDLYESRVIAAKESPKAADRAAKSRVRRTGHTCGVAQLLTSYQAGE